MRFTAKIIVLALTATAVSAQNYVNGTRTWMGNGNWATWFNGTGESCGTNNNGGCDVDCSNYGSSGNNAMTLNMFSGASDDSSFTYRMHNIANLHASQLLINQQNNPVPLKVYVDAGFTATNIYLGSTGYLQTFGSLNQNSAVLNVANFVMAASSFLNSAAFKLNVGNSLSVSDGATINLATMIINTPGSTTTSIGNVQLTTSVGLLISSVLTATNTQFNIGGELILENPAGTTASSTTCLTCSGSTVVNTADMYTVAPTSTYGCPVTVTGTLFSTPAANTGNKKRDGNTQSTTFTGGSTNTNSLTQTGSYLNNLLRKRDMNEKRIAVYPNQLVLAGSHHMQVNSGLSQNGVNPTIKITSCSGQMKMDYTTQSVTQACPGCSRTATGCTNGGFITQPAANQGGTNGGNKRGDEESN